MNKIDLSFFKDWLIQLGLSQQLAGLIRSLILIAVVIFLAWLVDFISRKILLASISRLVKKSKNRWDDIILHRRVLHRIAHIAPAFVIYYSAKIGLVNYPGLSDVIQIGTYIFITVISLMIIDSLFSALNDIYETLPIAKDRPIKGYIQGIKIAVYFIGILFIISILFDKDMKTLFAGLGAVAAILILVFKDTILGFVSSIQLSANKMVKPGDWISMPGRNADGIVKEINLNTVKVQNWDKTISTIPTYALISESFQNWKGMEDSRGRRIARSIHIDIKTIRFCNNEMLEKFKKIKIIKDYVIQKQKEIEDFNQSLDADINDKVSRRNLTNVGVFRKYIMTYLKNHPKIHPDKLPYIILVRHFEPTERGLPIQIYAFSKEYAWAKYEDVQADIFDHILAVIPEFELRLFQNPSSDDFRNVFGRASSD